MLKENNNRSRLFWWIVFAFTILPLIVSVVSTIHVIRFFELSNPPWLSIVLALSFEIGALSSLAALVVMDKVNRNVIWALFIGLTLYQMAGNTYHAYDTITIKMVTDANLIKNWVELFGFDSSDLITVKRILAIKSGAVLPLFSLGFLHLLVRYIQKSGTTSIDIPVISESINEPSLDIDTNSTTESTKVYPWENNQEIQNEVTPEESKNEVIEHKRDGNIIGKTRDNNIKYTSGQ